MSTPSDIQAAIDTATVACLPAAIVPGSLYAITLPEGGSVRMIDVQSALEPYLDVPRRKTGRATVTTADAFIQYLAKHGQDNTEVWADITRSTVTAVINAPTADTAGHGDHTATLQLRMTDDWTAWVAGSGAWQGQEQFSEFVEDHLPNFVNPVGAEMLEVAQSIKATTKVDFESSKRLANGETQLLYKETTEGSAGRKGDLTIPQTFALGLIPFESGDQYKVTARLRYRIVSGNLSLSYVLDRPRDVLLDAFAGIVTGIEEDTDRLVWHGKP